jgi:hypothetical protein
MIGKNLACIIKKVHLLFIPVWNYSFQQLSHVHYIILHNRFIQDNQRPCIRVVCEDFLRTSWYTHVLHYSIYTCKKQSHAFSHAHMFWFNIGKRVYILRVLCTRRQDKVASLYLALSLLLKLPTSQHELLFRTPGFGMLGC